MTAYFRLVDDMTIPNRWHLGFATLSDGSEPRLRAGFRLDSPESLSIPVTHAGSPLEFTLTSFAVPVATGKLASAVSVAAENEVQVAPVCIAGQTGMAVLNALRVVRCLDESRSEFVKWTTQDHRADLAGQYRQITRMVLDPLRIPTDAHFFRIEGSLV